MNILWSILSPFRDLFMFIDGIAYSLLDNAYNIVIELSTGEIMGQEAIKSITNNLYILIGVIAFFRLALVLVNSIIDPEKLNEKGKGLSNIFFRVVGMIILLIVTPFLFSLSYEIQGAIVGADTGKNIIFSTLLGDNASITDKDNNGGKALQNIALSSLITVDSRYLQGTKDNGGKLKVCKLKKDKDKKLTTEFEESDCGFLPLTCVPTGNNECELRGGYIYDTDICKSSNCREAVTLYNTMYVAEDMSPSALANYAGVSRNLDEYNNEEVYVYNYMLIVTTFVGGFMTYIILSFAIDIAVRMFELVVLQILSPLFIATFVDPKSSQSGPFKNWLSAIGKSYASLYIKLAIIALMILLISFVNQAEIFQNMGEISGWAKIIAVIGLLIFAKKAPKWIMDMIGIKGEDGLGGLSIGKKLGGMALAGGLINKANDGIKKGLKKQGGKILDHNKKRLGNIGNKMLGGYAARKMAQPDAQKAAAEARRKYRKDNNIKDGDRRTLAQRYAEDKAAKAAAKGVIDPKVKATRAQIQGDFKANNDMRAFAGLRDKYADYAKGVNPSYQTKRDKKLSELGDEVTKLRTAAGMGSDEIKKLEKEAADIRKGRAIYGDAFDVEKWRADKSLYPLASDKINNSYAEYLGGKNSTSSDEIRIAKYLKDEGIKLDASNLEKLLKNGTASLEINGKIQTLDKKTIIDTVKDTENSYQRAILEQAAYSNVISNSNDYVEAQNLMENARKEIIDLQYKMNSATSEEAKENLRLAIEAEQAKFSQYNQDLIALENDRIDTVLKSGEGELKDVVTVDKDGNEIHSQVLEISAEKVDSVDRTAVQFGNKWCTTSGTYELNSDGKWEFKKKDMTMYFDAIKKALEDKKAKQYDDAVQREEKKFKESEEKAKGSSGK